MDEEKLLGLEKPVELGGWLVDDFEFIAAVKLLELGGEKPLFPPELDPFIENEEEGGGEELDFLLVEVGEKETEDFGGVLFSFLSSNFIFPGFVFSTNAAG